MSRNAATLWTASQTGSDLDSRPCRIVVVDIADLQVRHPAINDPLVAPNHQDFVVIVGTAIIAGLRIRTAYCSNTVPSGNRTVARLRRNRL